MKVLNTSPTEATLCFLIRGDEVLLAEKQKKLGAGFLNGFGGKVESTDVSVEAANAREVEEENGVRVTNFKNVGAVTFHNPSEDNELKDMIVHMFVATEWDGEPMETDEMKKIAWYVIAELDYSKFLAGDRLFLPLILGGKSVRGAIWYNDDWSVRDSQIEEL